MKELQENKEMNKQRKTQVDHQNVVRRVKVPKKKNPPSASNTERKRKNMLHSLKNIKINNLIYKCNIFFQKNQV
ncbi:MAG: hypothetical protein K2H66_04415, partial [Oscillospiraceae bacterium]|nr:hypothetical protein [Oscillospiraceae bacterium]